MLEKILNNIFSKNYLPFLVLAGFGFILYFQAFFFGFSYLDDNVLILGNQTFLSNINNIFWSFGTDVFHLFNSSAFYYRPLLTISFILDYQIGGASPFIYHFVNVLLHILAACLLFIFLKKLDYKKELAFLFSFIFLIHPVMTQTVAWIPGRNDSLLAIFLLLTFIFFVKYVREEKNRNLFWSLFFCGLAFFTKESGILIIPIIFFYFYFIYQKQNKEAGSEKKKAWRQSFYFFIGSIGLAGVWAGLRYLVLRNSTGITLPEMIKSVFFNLPAVIQFLGKIFLPFNLSVLPIMQDTTFVYGIIAAILLFLLIFFTKNKRWNFILLGFGWFLAFLLPSFIRPNTSLVADFIEHRLYVPIIGIFIVLLETDFIRKIDFKKRSAQIAIGFLLILFCAITLIHSRSFADKMAFWKDAVAHSPHYPLAHRNLGAMDYLAGDLADAEKESKIALALNPTEQMAHNNLGLIYAEENKFDQAETEYKMELANNPYYDDAYYNLGILYWQEKKYDAAIADWKETLEINPNYAVSPEIWQILQNSNSK
ncbi:MAG: tetratricopeptide repeat protein [Minisyncoccia bacterium]